MTLFDTFTGIGASFRTHSRNQNPESTDGQIDVEVEIVFTEALLAISLRGVKTLRIIHREVKMPNI